MLPDSVGFNLVIWMNKLKTFHVLIPIIKMVISLGGVIYLGDVLDTYLISYFLLFFFLPSLMMMLLYVFQKRNCYVCICMTCNKVKS